MMAIGVILLSCGKEKPPIPQSQMVNILMDIHLSEAMISGGNYRAALKDSIESSYLNQVLEKWEITKPGFEEALNHMHSDPAYMREVLQQTLEQVNDFSNKLDEEDSKEKEERRKDYKKKSTQDSTGNIPKTNRPTSLN